MKGKSRKRKAISAALACAALFALLLSLALPAAADVPAGAGEVEEAEDLEPIWLFDEEGELIKFEITDNDVRGFRKGNVPIEVTIDGVDYPDGELDLDEVIAFRALQLGIAQLWPEDIPDRENLAVAMTNPSPVMEGIMEYMTACVTRGACDIDAPPGTDVEDIGLENYVFVFKDIKGNDKKDDEKKFETRVLEGVFPEGFFDLREDVLLFEANVEEEREYLEQWQGVRDFFLTGKDGVLFDLKDEKTSLPLWPLIFSMGLLLAVAGTTIYGAARGRS
ncbi:MAG: hypothetical protein ACOC78_03045 [Actinomycetota bacterium]